MAELKSSEKFKLEKYFQMGSGYVCDFSNRTFQEFVLENTGIDIYGDTYTGSKANRLRSFWTKESTHLVAKLLSEMLEYWKTQRATPLSGYYPFEPALYEECKKIVARLQSASPIDNVEALTPNANEKDFALLSQSIRASIDKNQPEQALDRLHTFVVKYIRALCTEHAILFDKDTPLHSLFGGYVKFLQSNDLIESEMSIRILKSSISVLDAFNDVRNNQSFAHDNPMLNYNESVLIFNDISNIIRFVSSVEHKISEQKAKLLKQDIDWADISYSDEEIDAAGDAWIQSELDRRRGK